MFYRKLIREKKLCAAITIPFLSTITPAEDSAIQTSRDARTALSMQVDLALRRLLYFQTWNPSNCSEVLNDLAKILSTGLAPNALETQILEIVENGRSRGRFSSY